MRISTLKRIGLGRSGGYLLRCWPLRTPPLPRRRHLDPLNSGDYGLDDHFERARAPDDYSGSRARSMAAWCARKTCSPPWLRHSVAACIITVLWMVIGYSVAFTNNPNSAVNAYIGSFNYFMLGPMALKSINPLAGTIPESVFMFFQMTFAIITPALIAGALAESHEVFGVHVVHVAVAVARLCPIAGIGCGVESWLSAWGALDYAGGTVVHLNAGTAGLITCLVLGPRIGLGAENMAPHNLVHSVIGAWLLWVGWFGFNASKADTAKATTPAWRLRRRRLQQLRLRCRGCTRRMAHWQKAERIGHDLESRRRTRRHYRRRRASSMRKAHSIIGLTASASSATSPRCGCEEVRSAMTMRSMRGACTASAAHAWGAMMTGAFADESDQSGAHAEGQPGSMTATVTRC